MDKLQKIKEYCEMIIAKAEANPADQDGDIFLVGIEEGECSLAGEIISLIEE